MAFPGTYNISYYKGDTFEFRIYPKTSTGDQFLLNDYTQIRFTMSNVLGEQVAGGPTKVTLNGFAEKRDNQYVLCAITPDNGANMVAGTTYYYDVEIGRINSPYDYVYTLLQGTVTVAEQTTPAAALPGAPTNLTITDLGATSATVTWAPPAGTAPVSTYKIYLVLGGNLIPVTTVPYTTTTFTFSPLQPATTYTLAITAENTSGEGLPATVSGTTDALGS